MQAQVIDRAFTLAQECAAADDSHMARQVASGLYNVVTMAGLRWEAKMAGLPQRAQIARQVLVHRLAPRDPLSSSAISPVPESDPLPEGD